MEYVLKTDNFTLTLNPQVFLRDLAYPSNTLMAVTVSSDDFSGKASMDIDAKQLGRFARDLLGLYETLNGEAKIQETYGDMFLAFSGDGRGHIRVKGFLQSYYGDNVQELHFGIRFDQTWLRCFSAELFEAFGKYADHALEIAGKPEESIETLKKVIEFIG